MDNIEVKFEYGSESSFADLANSLERFREVVAIYAKKRKYEMNMSGIEKGSLVCRLACDSVAKSCIELIASDFQDLSGGRKNPLLPYRVVKAYRSLFSSAPTVSIIGTSFESVASDSVLGLLADRAEPSQSKLYTCIGKVDKIDLREDQFRVVNSVGSRTICSNAFEFLSVLNSALHAGKMVQVAGLISLSTTEAFPKRLATQAIETLGSRKSLAECLTECRAL